MTRAIDLSGQRFGAWVVVREAKRSMYRETTCGPAKWECRCDCGATGTIPGTDLRAGRSAGCRACGQRRRNGTAPVIVVREPEAETGARVVVAGMRFGLLNVMRPAPYSPIHHVIGDDLTPLWFCQCDCGNEQRATTRALLDGKATGCRSCMRRQARADK